MRLEEQRVQRLEAGRLAEFVDCTEHVDTVADAFDGDAASGEALYVSIFTILFRVLASYDFGQRGLTGDQSDRDGLLEAQGVAARKGGQNLRNSLHSSRRYPHTLSPHTVRNFFKATGYETD